MNIVAIYNSIAYNISTFSFTWDQVVIMICSSLAIWFIGRRETWSRWGFIIGFVGQPFWIYTAIVNKQPGVFVLSIWYVYAWGQGIWNFWIKKNK